MKNLSDSQPKNLESMYWAGEIKLRKEGASYTSIQKEFQKKSHESNTQYYCRSSGSLYKNSRGITKASNHALIKRIEEKLPGTKRLLTHPLWAILKKPEASLSEVYGLMNELPIDLRNKLFSYKNDGSITRKHIKSRCVLYISKRNDIDALACILLLIREAELTKQIGAYIGCKWEARDLFCRIASFEPLKSMATFVYSEMFKHFIERNNPLPKDLSNELVEHFPNHFTIPKKYPIPRFLNENRNILKLAIDNGIINSSLEDQLDFLFWIDFEFKRREILAALLSLTENHFNNDSTSENIESLNKLITMMRGDSRDYIKGEIFMI